MADVHELSTTETENHHWLTTRRLVLGGSVLGLSATLAWATAALLMANRGFDMTDEGFYLLSYRWYDSNLHSFTGAQYLYGPVFEALQHNVAALRVFRLLTVLTASSAFAIAFVWWLGAQVPAAQALRWRVAGASMITASGGLIYAWLPLSPGYNDVAALGIVATAAVVLATASYAHAGLRSPAWLPLLGGVLCLVQLLGKWSSALGLALCGVVVIIVLRKRGWPELARFIGLTLVGFLVAAAVVHLFVVPLDRALAEMWFVNKSAADEGGSLTTRALGYRTQMGDFTRSGVVLGAPILAAAVLSRLVGKGRVTALWAGLVAVAFAVFWALVIRSGGWKGGVGSYPDFNLALMALALAVAVAGAGIRRPTPDEAAVLLMLFLVPMTQAFGTSNPLWLSAAEAYTPWFALLIWFAVTAQPRPRAQLVAWTGAASALVLVPIIVSTGLLSDPYRATGFAESTTAAPGIPSIRVSADTAREYAALRDAVGPHLHSTPTPILALQTMPGLIYVVGGTAAGEPWTGGGLRTGKVLVRACNQGEVGPSNPPLVIFNRPLRRHDFNMLRRCGFQPREDFHEIDVPSGPPGVRVLVPTR